MPVIVFIKGDTEVACVADEGQTVLGAALQNGMHINHSCGAHNICGTCRVLVRAGCKNLLAEDQSPPARNNDYIRACRQHITGDVVVELRRAGIFG